MRRLLICLVMTALSISAFAAPPTIGPDTTFFEAPLDDEGYVDYIAAANAEFNTPPIRPADNAFLGILNQSHPMSWPDGHRAALYDALGVDPPADDQPQFLSFREYAIERGLPQAPPFDWDNAEPGEQPPPPPPGTSEAMEIRANAEPWTRDDLPEVARWLDSIQAPLDAISLAIDRPGYYAPLVRPHEHATMIEVYLPHLGVHRSAARAMDYRARRALAWGDLDAAINDWATLKRLSRLQSREPMMIGNLVGISIQALSHDLFQLILSQPGLEADHLGQMSEVLNNLPDRVPMEHSLYRFERLSSLDMLVQASRGRVEVLETVQYIMQTTARDEPRTFLVAEDRPAPFTALISHPRFNLDRALRRVNSKWENIFADLPADTTEFMEHCERVETEMESQSDASWELMPTLIALGTQGVPADADADQITDQVTDLLLSLLSPGLSSAILTERQAAAQAALEPVALNVASYRLDHGRYPPLLQSLVPRYLETLPDDPFGSQSMRYRRDGKGFRLYSVGQNLIDDQGHQDFKEGDIVLRVPWSAE